MRQNLRTQYMTASTLSLTIRSRIRKYIQTQEIDKVELLLI